MNAELVRVTIDGKDAHVPKGTGLVESAPNGQPPCARCARNSSRNFVTQLATGIAAESPSTQRHLPMIRSQTESSRSRSPCAAVPSSIARSTCTIQRVPSRHGVHFPQDSCM